MVHLRSPPSADSESPVLPLTAYALSDSVADDCPIVPAVIGRDWMRETHKQFAHRCLPLLVANQSGWFLLNNKRFQVTWTGNTSLSSLEINYFGDRPAAPLASSVFGYGILTWRVDYLFRTPPGYNLTVRGPANLPKDGICALEGIVETDWAVATFTMNWKLTRPRWPVTFEAGEPFCMIAPQRRHEIERFDPTITSIDTRPELAAQWAEFQKRRMLMAGARQLALRTGGSCEMDKVPFERHYFEGTSPGGWSAAEHQQKLAVRRFRRVDDS